MSFYAIGEPEYKTSNWYKDILNGLMNEKRQKRFALTLLDSIDELNQVTISDEDIIFVIGTNSEWLEKIIDVCESIFDNRVIVLANHENRLHKGKYSIVTADITRSVQILYSYLQVHKKERIAMYGINPESTSDAFRKRSFLACGGSEKDMFYNLISLSQCYDDFAQKMDNYDAVICVNDYAAISLVRHLKDYKQLFITSCGAGTLISKFFSPSITHTRIDYQSFAKAGLDLCRILQKNSNANSVNIYLASDFVLGETTDNLPFFKEAMQEIEKIHKDVDKFYSDLEIDEMIRIEKLLNSCDSEDLLILKRILDNATYSSIAEELFMSTNGVKYKLKNMFNICNVSSKTEFVDLLSKYIKTHIA
ncbi:MAG: hypothetical protein IJZ53_12535 [Tyzzerella sp.]|nr:hypothetical protein [Tyzzerella sp.]